MDLNGDGYNDILSGSWPGAIYFFKGGPDNTFAAPEKLKNKNGELINVGSGIEDQPDMLLIRGDAEFITEDGKQKVGVYVVLDDKENINQQTMLEAIDSVSEKYDKTDRFLLKTF